MKIAKVVGFCLAVMLLASPVWAANGLVGLGAGVIPDYEGSEDYQATPLLMVKYTYDSGRYVYLKGTNLKFNLLADQAYSVGPVVNYRFGRDDVDNNKVDAMDKIDDSLELGAFAAAKFGSLMLEVEYLAGVTGGTKSHLMTATASYKLQPSDTLTITPGVFTTFAGREYLDTHFGVNASNVGSSGLPYYNDADKNAFKDVGANITVHMTPWENWGVMGIASVSTLLGDVKDSPIVDDEGSATQWFAGLMATYRWKK
jgi:outer membrane scaffolding protein for murein synthesis (MipA/OmpV family)